MQLRIRLLVAALALVSVVAAMAVVGLIDWSGKTHESFRDEVVTVLAQRFHRVATPVPGEPDAIEIAGQRRDLRSLFAIAARESEPERGAAIYEWFLGDTTTIGRPIVREDPFAAADPPASPPTFAVAIQPKRVKTLRVGPDGAELR